MKLIQFPSYARTFRDDVGRPAVQARAWYIAFAAVGQSPSGPTAERSAQVNKLYNGLKDLMQTEGEGDEQKRFLKPEGGTLIVEDAEIKTFREIIDGFRANVSGAGSDALVFLDTLIANAPESPKLLA